MEALSFFKNHYKDSELTIGKALSNLENDAMFDGSMWKYKIWCELYKHDDKITVFTMTSRGGTSGNWLREGYEVKKFDTVKEALLAFLEFAKDKILALSIKD